MHFTSPFRVLTQTGEQYVERRDPSLNHVVVTALPSKAEGFVVDTQPDRQVSEVLPGLLLGSQDVAADLDLLLANRITHVLNVSYDVPNFFADRFVYVHCPMLDDLQFDLRPCLRTCLTFVDESLRGGGVVLVHCNAGLSRSVAVAVAYLMRFQQMSFEGASRKILTCRPRAQPNAGFVTQLKQMQNENEL